MSMTFAALDSFPVSAWRNGAGKTREIAISPADRYGVAGAVWRISLASITQDCAFSFFPGFARSLALACDGRLTLTGLATGPQVLQNSGDIVHFSGEDAVFAGCHGTPVQAFNLMAAPTFGAEMHCHAQSADMPGGHMAFLLPVHGTWRLEGYEQALTPGMIAMGPTGRQPLRAMRRAGHAGRLVAVLLPSLS
ncbi:HutD family protein [Acetobacter sp. TBRC 12305]|uniref:HutD family protein n=1 Tax=Acetobacter garciniae TaxID=2817435 RepID=A0A939HMR8_9PROT|nr:HutD family protein [Acetobacter garciniae]MBO1324509.1 HutD family protein [Acetobacter garciniae]MBX0344198.1 HutD family protein [Acetobacter garciniae]